MSIRNPRALGRLVVGAAGAALAGLLVAAAPASAGLHANQVAQPLLTHTPTPVRATIGSVLKDTATLRDGNNPTFYIGLELHDPSGDLFWGIKVGVRGNGTYGPVVSEPVNRAGTWSWRAIYTGDQNNLSAVAPIVSVVVTAVDAQPTVQVAATPAAAVVGQNLGASATLSGGNNPGSAMRFTLYDPAGKAAFSEDVAVHGTGTYATATGHVADVAGTWHWKAEYPGDPNNRPATSTMQSVVVAKAAPEITQIPNLTSATVGVTLRDTVHLVGGSNPRGTIAFTLYDPSGQAAYTEKADVTGDGYYTTVTGHAAGGPGTWEWTAAYSGDQNNLSAETGAARIEVAPVTKVAAGSANPLGLALIGAALLGIALLVPLVAYLRKRQRA